jgi:hypothetical protein
LTDWRYWEQRADHDRRIKYPAGYLVSKGRKGAKAPTSWRDAGHQEISELAERPPSPREQVMSQYKIDAGTMDLWDRVATDLKGQMAWGTFDQHLTGAVLFPVKNGQVVVGIKRKQSRDWLENRLAPTVQRTLARHLGQEQIDLSFRVLT